MRNGLWLAVFLVAALAVAAWFRLADLGAKPMHGDEANQAVKTGRLLETGEYRYDPHDHHGPTLYYLTLPVLWASGTRTLAESDEWQYRLVPVLFGLGLFVLLWPLRQGLGAAPTAVAALLTAVSPAFVYFNRFYIQETLLVCFTLLAIVSGWRYYVSRHWAWAVLAGVGIGLMHATKETAILAYAAMAAGIVATALAGGWRGRWQSVREAVKPAHVVWAVVAAVAVSVLFFSSFLTHARGPLDSILTYRIYADRAHGAGMHDKAWYYYLQLLAYSKFPFGPRWSEGLIPGLALVGGIAAFLRRTAAPGDARFQRFLAFYTLFLTVAYAWIGYKTPWSMLGFLHGMILLAGIGAVALVRWARVLPAKVAVAALLAAGVWHLGLQADRATGMYAADMRNPYVYAHSVPDVLRLGERAEELAAVAPEGHRMLIRVMAPGGDYWPIPWYLRRFEQVGYYDRVPPEADADLIIVGRDLQPELDAQLRNTYQVQFYGLRPNVIVLAYIRQDLWDRFMEGRQ